MDYSPNEKAPAQRLRGASMDSLRLSLAETEGFRIPCESIAYAADATKHTTLPLLHQRTHVSRGGDAMGFAA